jgi:flavin-dependent dehydrogenase
LVSYGGPQHGYAWLFPKSQHLSVGIGDFVPRRQELLTKFKAFTDSLGIFWQRDDLRAHPIPLAGINRRFCRPRLLLAGDAAGLADPLSGEGIAYAIHSGLLAADSILEAFRTGDFSMEKYQEAVETQINRELRIARQLAATLYRRPRALFQLFRRNHSALAWYFEAVKGERNYGDVWDLVKATLRPQALFGRHQQAKCDEIAP